MKVPYSNTLSAVDGVTNVVQVLSDNLGTSTYVGPGAGRLATANSVVADILEVEDRLALNKDAARIDSLPNSNIPSEVESDFEADFFIRLHTMDHVGVVHKVSGVFQKHSVSIFSILQTPITDPDNVPFAIVAQRCRLSQVVALCKDLDSKRLSGEFSFLVCKPIFVRYLD